MATQPSWPFVDAKLTGLFSYCNGRTHASREGLVVPEGTGEKDKEPGDSPCLWHAHWPLRLGEGGHRTRVPLPPPNGEASCRPARDRGRGRKRRTAEAPNETERGRRLGKRIVVIAHVNTHPVPCFLVSIGEKKSKDASARTVFSRKVEGRPAGLKVDGEDQV